MGAAVIGLIGWTGLPGARPARGAPGPGRDGGRARPCGSGAPAGIRTCARAVIAALRGRLADAGQGRARRVGPARRPAMTAAPRARFAAGLPARGGSVRAVVRSPRMLWLAVLLSLGMGAQAAAQEYVSVRATLGDDDFYRVVACAARPGHPCRKPYLRWPEAQRRDLAVALEPGPLDREGRHRHARALDAALDEINAQRAGIRLRRVEGPAAITVHPVKTPPGAVMRGTGVADLDGTALPLALVTVRARGGEIRSARVAVSTHTPPGELPSILLEEMVQALGLITDIRGAAYSGSLFSEDGNHVASLAGQDAMALRRHYGAPARMADAGEAVSPRPIRRPVLRGSASATSGSGTSDRR